MRNFLNPFRTSRTAENSDQAAETRGSRGHEKRSNRARKRYLLAGSVLAVGAIVGSGFAMQSNVAATNKSIAATEALASSTGRHSDQLSAYGAVFTARAERRAKDTINGANTVLAEAKGKTDTAALSSSVASLSNFELLAPERIYVLVSQTNAASADVKVAVKKADRLAAEKAAKKAAKEAAEKAAKEAAAEEAAQEAAQEAEQEAEQEAAEQEESSNKSAPSRPSAPSDPSGAQAIARDMMASQYGWGGDQFGCLVSLWDRESGWNVNAYNASSGATGIPQALPGSKMASAGGDWETNPATQISWGLGYIAGSYGTPCAAWDHSESVGWY